MYKNKIKFRLPNGNIETLTPTVELQTIIIENEALTQKSLFHHRHIQKQEKVLRKLEKEQIDKLALQDKDRNIEDPNQVKLNQYDRLLSGLELKIANRREVIKYSLDIKDKLKQVILDNNKKSQMYPLLDDIYQTRLKHKEIPVKDPLFVYRELPHTIANMTLYQHIDLT